VTGVLGESDFKKEGVLFLFELFYCICLFGKSFEERCKDNEVVQYALCLKILNFLLAQLGNNKQLIRHLLYLFVFVVNRLPKITERQTKVGQLLGVSGCLW
jgi:hypothetical protein